MSLRWCLLEEFNTLTHQFFPSGYLSLGKKEAYIRSLQLYWVDAFSKSNLATIDMHTLQVTAMDFKEQFFVCYRLSVILFINNVSAGLKIRGEGLQLGRNRLDFNLTWWLILTLCKARLHCSGDPLLWVGLPLHYSSNHCRYQHQ